MPVLPTFFYNPNAYKIGIIQPENIVCKCCGAARNFSYKAGLYSRHRREETHPLCPWCIADGRAAAKFNGSFVGYFDNVDPDPSHVNQPVSAASLETVSHRTPGYIALQDLFWLTHCDEACVFLGYVGSKELLPVWEEVLPDIVAGEWDEDDVRNHLDQNGDMVGYLFQCPRCGQHRLHIDAS
ncbi:MAG: CbrC family protein [Janthinobacterium lividum]